jgi:hypothetical protein
MTDDSGIDALFIEEAGRQVGCEIFAYFVFAYRTSTNTVQKQALKIFA